MSGPWEQYQSNDTAGDGPWEQYAAPKSKGRKPAARQDRPTDEGPVKLQPHTYPKPDTATQRAAGAAVEVPTAFVSGGLGSAAGAIGAGLAQGAQTLGNVLGGEHPAPPGGSSLPFNQRPSGLGVEGGVVDWLKSRDPQNTFNTIQQAMTVQPKSQGGKDAMALLNKPQQWLGEQAGKAGDYLAQRGYPGAATAVDLGIQAAPQVALQKAMGKAMPLAGEPPPPPKTMFGMMGNPGYEASKMNVAKDAALKAGVSMGLSVPAKMIDNSPTATRMVEDIAGIQKMGQAASHQNAKVYNKAARKELGTSETTPLTQDVFDHLYEQQYEVYRQAARANFGTTYGKVQPPHLTEWDTIPTETERPTGVLRTEAFTKAMQDHYKDIVGPTDEMPGFFKKLPGVAGEMKDLMKTEWTPENVLRAIRDARLKAKDDFKNTGDKATQIHKRGAWHLQVARELEGVLQENLENNGNALTVDKIREARKQIAKLHDYEDATNLVTGELIPAKLSLMRKRGKPLSGTAKTIADMFDAYPDAMRDPARTTQPAFITPFDWMFAAHGHPGAAATEVVGRNIAPRILLRGTKHFSMPDYQPFTGGRTARAVGRAALLPGAKPQPPGYSDQ